MSISRVRQLWEPKCITADVEIERFPSIMQQQHFATLVHTLPTAVYGTGRNNLSSDVCSFRQATAVLLSTSCRTMQRPLNLPIKEERLQQQHHYASSSFGSQRIVGESPLNPFLSTPPIDLKVWQDESILPRACASISQTPSQNSQLPSQERKKNITEPPAEPLKRRLGKSFDQDEECMDLPLSQRLLHKEKEQQTNHVTVQTERLSQLSQVSSNSSKVRADKALRDAIRTNKIELTPLELQVMDLVRKQRPQPGNSARAFKSKQREGWTKRTAITRKLDAIENEPVERAIESLIERGIFECTENRRGLGDGELRRLAQSLLEQLLLPSLKKIYQLDPESHPPKYGPNLKAVYIASICNCLMGNETGRSPISITPSNVKKKRVQKLHFRANSEFGKPVEVWERVANAVIDEAGSCVRITKDFVERIEELHVCLKN